METICNVCGLTNGKYTNPQCGSDNPHVKCPFNLPTRFAELDKLNGGISNVCGCGVPIELHNTCCGWENANLIAFEGEQFLLAYTSPEEREIRWLISKSSNSKKLSQWWVNHHSVISVGLNNDFNIPNKTNTTQ